MTDRNEIDQSTFDLAIGSNDALLAFAPSGYWRISGSSPHSPTNEFIRRVTSAAESGDWTKVKAPPGSFGMRGGDFLPGFRPFEVEIARLALESTTWDVISIRARPSSRGILYRAVNEYASEFIIRPMSSKKPLSLAGLIKLIDGMTNGGRLSSPAALRASQGPFENEKAIRDVEAFVTVASDFYPDLEAWYDQDASAWVQAELEELPRRLLNDQVARDAECARLADDASKDDAVALMKLGYRHFIGNGVKRSRTKAVELWRRAADLGEPTAMFNLAVCLQDGMGCKRDRKSALVLHEKLAEQDYYVGLSMAAYCRYVGIGCRANKALALQWHLKMAKAAGPDVYSPGLARCLNSMNGKSKIEREAVDWIRDAARQTTTGSTMLRELHSSNKSKAWVKHDAGVGYLGDKPLKRFAR